MIEFSMWDTFKTMLFIMSCFAAGYLAFYTYTKVNSFNNKTKKDIITYLISSVVFVIIVIMSILNNDWHKTNTGFYSETFFIGIVIMMILMTNLRINYLINKRK